MFNSAPFNTQVYNGGAPGLPFICYVATRQTVVAIRDPLVQVACQQIIWRQDPGEVCTRQVVYAVLRDETHLIQV